jgi:hypothetical protein
MTSAPNSRLTSVDTHHLAIDFLDIKRKAIMTKIFTFLSIVAFACMASPASAFQLRSASNGGSCSKDGSTCKVYCDNGQLAGSMNWNGSVWTDGAKSDPDMNAEARKICAANGTACT